jgi:hypothetical protein
VSAARTAAGAPPPPGGSPSIGAAGTADTARTEARAEILRGFGAGAGELEELLAYTNPVWIVPESVDLPLEDEPSAIAWREYAAGAASRGVLPVLREHLVQLRFPITEGISATEVYGAAIRRGIVPESTDDLRLEDEDGLRLFIHPTMAGAVPVLLAATRADFVTLLRALTRRNEPVPIPPSMGAMMVGGYNNWGRVAALRAAWEAGEFAVEGAAAWTEVFRVLRERRELYQDRFVLLSPGPYSGVSAERMELDSAEWSRASITIRLEHECAHYFTRRVLGSMRNHLLDELLADYCGIVAAAGRYRADWALRFLGLEDADGCRADGRMWSYRSAPPLSDAAFAVIQRVVRAILGRFAEIEAALDSPVWTMKGSARTLLSLAPYTLEELATGTGRPPGGEGCLDRSCS